MELTKSEKRIARELVSKSVDEECRQFMEKAEALVGRRRDDQAPKERFWELHDMFREFARHLTQKYDSIPGSYDLKIMRLYMEKRISKEDVERFAPETQEWIFNIEKSAREYKEG